MTLRRYSNGTHIGTLQKPDWFLVLSAGKMRPSVENHTESLFRENGIQAWSLEAPSVAWSTRVSFFPGCLLCRHCSVSEVVKVATISTALLYILFKLRWHVGFGRQIYYGSCSVLVLWSMSLFLSRCCVLPNKGKTCVSQCCDKSEV